MKGQGSGHLGEIYSFIQETARRVVVKQQVQWIISSRGVHHWRNWYNHFGKQASASKAEDMHIYDQQYS